MNINNIPMNPDHIIINNNAPINNQLVHIQEQLNDIYNILQVIVTNNYVDNMNINNVHNMLYNIQNMLNGLHYNDNQFLIIQNMINNQNNLINHIINNN